MDEITRQEYLQKMGIQAYFPRYILPAALISEPCDWPDLVEQISGSVEASEISEFSSLKAGLKTELKAELKTSLEPAQSVELKSLPETETAKLAAGESPVTSQIEPESNEIRFQLAFIQVNDAILALILLPHVRASNSLSQAHKLLFRNICISLNQDSADLNFDIKPFSWPFAESIHMDKSETAAKTALGAYMEQLRDVYKYQHLLLMGENLLRLVTAVAGCDITACRSLDEMLKMPQLKREVWQQLKHSNLITAV